MPFGSHTQPVILATVSVDGTNFMVNGHYTGGSGCGKEPCQHWLFYEGHPGFDYPELLGTSIFAPADGIAFIPDSDPITSKRDPISAVDKFNILAVDHGNGFATWYLHLGEDQTGEDFRIIQCPGDPAHTIQKGERIPVTRDCQIGKVGNKGTASPHLHFEVRKGITDFQCTPPACFPIDPYGWTAPLKFDPYLGGPNIMLWE